MSANEGEQISFTRRVLLVVAIVALFFLGLTLLYFTFDILLLIFAAALLAIFLKGLADILRRWIPLSEGWLVLIVSAILLLIIAGAVAVLAPSVAEQVRMLRTEIPRSAQQTGEFLARYSAGQWILQHLPSADEVMTSIDAGAMLSRVGGFFSSTVGSVGNILITVLLAIYLASEPKFYSAGMTRLFPLGVRDRAQQVLQAIYETLRWWLIGKAISMVFIGIVTWIGLSLLGVPLALTLGLIAGLLSFIPNFGPIIAAVPALLLAFIANPISAVYVLALYVGIQVIEGNLVTPFIERKTVELAPALTIVFQVVLASLIGGLGIVLATPLLAVLVVIVRMVYFEDILGDRPGSETIREVEERSPEPPADDAEEKPSTE